MRQAFFQIIYNSQRVDFQRFTRRGGARGRKCLIIKGLHDMPRPYKRLGVRPTTSLTPALSHYRRLPLPHEAAFAIPQIMIVAVAIRTGFLVFLIPILAFFVGSELGIEWATIHPLKVSDNFVA